MSDDNKPLIENSEKESKMIEDNKTAHVKPREFWLDDTDFDLNWKKVFVAEYPHNETKSDAIHVIEKSAYTALQAEVERLNAGNNQLLIEKIAHSHDCVILMDEVERLKHEINVRQNWANDLYIDERDIAQAQLAAMTSELKNISDLSNHAHFKWAWTLEREAKLIAALESVQSHDSAYTRAQDAIEANAKAREGKL